MIKKINVSGIQIDNYSVREQMMLLDKEVASPSLSIVEEVSMDLLLKAQQDDDIRKALELATYTVITETGILEAAGESVLHRKREIENRGFFHEMMRRLERHHKGIFLLGETIGDVEQMEQFLKEEYPRCEFVGMAGMDICVGTADAIVNEINAATADVMISILPSPLQQYFLLENKDKISASLWYCVDCEKLITKQSRLVKWIRKHIHKKKLEEHIVNYEEKGENMK